MTKTTRRNLLKVAAAGGVSAVLGVATKTEARAQQRYVSGPPAATATFGFFPVDATVDRMQVANPGNRNGHQMGPFQVTIRAGGMVNFIIDGNHQVVVYDDGIQPRNINADLVLPPPLLMPTLGGYVLPLGHLAIRSQCAGLYLLEQRCSGKCETTLRVGVLSLFTANVSGLIAEEVSGCG